MDRNDLPVFLAVARLQGFTAAAKELGLPVSGVSRRIARLEESLQTKLFLRTTRSVGLTAAGRVFQQRLLGVEEQLEDAVKAVRRAQNAIAGTLRITMPPDDGGVLWTLLSGFAKDHPDVDLVVTHTLDPLDLIRDQIDVALRGGPIPDTADFIAKPLLSTRIVLAASPAYLAEHGTPTRVEELAEHRGLCMDPWAPNAIRRVDGDRGPVRVTMRGRLRANRLETARRAALDGLGIAPLLELTSGADLESGRLVEVLRGALPDEAPFWVLVPTHREQSAAAGALVAHLLEAAQAL